MKNIYLLLFLLLLSACKKTMVDNTADMEVIHIDMATGSKDGDFSSFLEKIEMVPLETNDSVLLRGFDEFTYCEEQDNYIVMDNDMIVYLNLQK